jgi:DNA-binding NtrC family response regulator
MKPAKGAARPPIDAPSGPAPRVLIVDDDLIIAESLAEFVSAEGCEAATCQNAMEALAALEGAARATADEARRARPFSLVITDVAMPGMGGIDLLRRIGAEHPGVAAIMLTGYATIETAVEAVKAGAVDFLTKPLVDAELRIALQKALRQQAILAENVALRRQLDPRHALDNILGADHRMVKTFDLVEAVAASRTTVLMTGESGTGKSLIARAIHRRSPRAAASFVEISCGSIPETLLESELFGHMKGAYTGAHADKQGKFLAAVGGTIFLDEINSASPAMQLKLLRVLQERRFEPVGSTETVEVDARVILASNQPLEALVASGQFRQDLYYRINVVKIELPALRERPGDVALLAEHFLRLHCAELGKTIAGFTPEALDALRRYPWPGNVRELSNVVERACVLTRRQTLGIDDLPAHVVDPNAPHELARHARAGPAADDAVDAPDTPWTPTPLALAMEEPEKRIILKALRANDWNRQSTADQLQINRTTLYKKIKQYGLDRIAG